MWFRICSNSMYICVLMGTGSHKLVWTCWDTESLRDPRHGPQSAMYKPLITLLASLWDMITGKRSAGGWQLIYLSSSVSITCTCTQTCYYNNVLNIVNSTLCVTHKITNFLTSCGRSLMQNLFCDPLFLHIRFYSDPINTIKFTLFFGKKW